MSDMAMANDVPPPIDSGGGSGDAAIEAPGAQDPIAANDNVAIAEDADTAVAANDNAAPGAADPTLEETSAADGKPRNIFSEGERGALTKKFNEAAAKRGGKGGGDDGGDDGDGDDGTGGAGDTPAPLGKDREQLRNIPKGSDLEVVNRPLRRDPKPKGP